MKTFYLQWNQIFKLDTPYDIILRLFTFGLHCVFQKQFRRNYYPLVHGIHNRDTSKKEQGTHHMIYAYDFLVS